MSDWMFAFMNIDVNQDVGKNHGRVTGVAGDIGDRGQNQNRIDINLGSEQWRQQREQLSLEERLRQLEQTVYGEARYGVVGLLSEIRSVRETVVDIQRIVRNDANVFNRWPVWVVGAGAIFSALAEIWRIVFG